MENFFNDLERKGDDLFWSTCRDVANGNYDNIPPECWGPWPSSALKWIEAKNQSLQSTRKMPVERELPGRVVLLGPKQYVRAPVHRSPSPTHDGQRSGPSTNTINHSTNASHSETQNGACDVGMKDFQPFISDALEDKSGAEKAYEISTNVENDVKSQDSNEEPSDDEFEDVIEATYIVEAKNESKREGALNNALTEHLHDFSSENVFYDKAEGSDDANELAHDNVVSCDDAHISKIKPKHCTTSEQAKHTYSISDVNSTCHGYCYSKTMTGSLVISLCPTDQVIFQGLGFVRCLLGTVSILGYQFRQGEKRPVFAPKMESVLVIQSDPSELMTTNAKCEAEEIDWLNFDGQAPKWNKEESVTRGGIVDESFQQKMFTYLGNDETSTAQEKWDQLNLTMYSRMIVLELTDFPCPTLEHCLSVTLHPAIPSDALIPLIHYRPPHLPTTEHRPLPVVLKGRCGGMCNDLPVLLPNSWQKVVEQICVDHRNADASIQNQGVRVIVIGANCVGKNTFVRFLINSLLCDEDRFKDIDSILCEAYHNPKVTKNVNSEDCPIENNFCRKRKAHDDQVKDRASVKRKNVASDCSTNWKITTVDKINNAGYCTESLNSIVQKDDKNEPFILKQDPFVSLDSRLADPDVGFTSSCRPIPRPPVCMMDLNVRHPEHSLPGTVSCARYTAPIIGQAYLFGVAHKLRAQTKQYPFRGTEYNKYNKVNWDDENHVLCEKTLELMVGTSELLGHGQLYLGSAARLNDHVKKLHNNEPLVVNTSALDGVASAERLVDIMRVVNPTHVVHIAGFLNKAPTRTPFTCDYVNDVIRDKRGWYNGGLDMDFSVEEEDGSTRILPVTSNLTYKYARIPSVYQTIKTTDKAKLTDVQYSDMMIASYFSSLWASQALYIDISSCQQPLIVGYGDYAIHLMHHSNVPYTHWMLNLRMVSLVALCEIHPKMIVKVGPQQPSKIRVMYQSPCLRYARRETDDGPVWDETYVEWTSGKLVGDTSRLFKVHCWALVQRIDPILKEIYLFIPDDYLLSRKANTIVRQDLTIPNRFRNVFYNGFTNRCYQTFVPRSNWNAPLKYKNRRN